MSYAHRCARRPVCRSGTGACALVPVCVVRAWPHAFACQRVDVCVCGVHPRRTLRGADSGVRIVVLLTVYCRVVGRQTCMLCVILSNTTCTCSGDCGALSNHATATRRDAPTRTPRTHLLRLALHLFGCVHSCHLVRLHCCSLGSLEKRITRSRVVTSKRRSETSWHQAITTTTSSQTRISKDPRT